MACPRHCSRGLQQPPDAARVTGRTRQTHLLQVLSVRRGVLGKKDSGRPCTILQFLCKARFAKSERLFLAGANEDVHRIDAVVAGEELRLGTAEGNLRLLARFAVCLKQWIFRMGGRIGSRQLKKVRRTAPDLAWYHALTVPVHPWSTERQILDDLGGLKIAGRHFARLVVALHLEADLLAFDEFAHSGALYSRNMDERIRAAIVGLDEAEALGGIKPFNGASGHDEPFHSKSVPTTPKRCEW